MTPLSMQTAVPYLRARRTQQTRSAGMETPVNAARYAGFSFALGAGVALLVGAAGAFGGTAVANVFPGWSAAPLASAARALVLGLGASVLLYPLLALRWPRTARGPQPGLSLYIGEATGRLRERKHGRPARKGEPLVLGIDDACQNILVSGGIGAGKTTRVIHSLLLQLLDQRCGGLIFDIKGNFGATVRAAAEACAFPLARLHYIGPGVTRLNLLEGLTPEQAGMFLRSAMQLGGNDDSPIWVNTAENWCRAGLGIIREVERYSLASLHRFIFDPEYRAEVMAELEVRRERMSEREQRIVDSYRHYLDNEVARWDERFKSNVEATISQVLAPFAHPDLTDAFSALDGADVVNWADVLSGQVFVVDMPLKRWGLGGRVAYLFIKLRFFALVDARQANVKRDDPPVFFVCDEYQDVVSADRQGGLSDLNFWDKSRSAKLCGVISWQGIASIYAALGDRDVADAIEQNFRQKLYFRSEDEHTLDRIAHVFGRVEVERESTSRGSSSAKDHTTRSHSSSTTHTEKTLVDAQVVRQLGPDEAVAVLTIGGHATDDVIQMRPIYLDTVVQQTAARSPVP